MATALRPWARRMRAEVRVGDRTTHVRRGSDLQAAWLPRARLLVLATGPSRRTGHKPGPCPAAPAGLPGKVPTCPRRASRTCRSEERRVGKEGGAGWAPE